MNTSNAFNRRKFLKASVVTATGALAGSYAISEAGNLSKEIQEGEIIYRTLGKTGIRLPIVSMGVMRSDNPNLVKAALKTGIVHLDTAHVYQGGRNEEMLGKLLKDYPRDSFIISTKIKGEGMNELSDDEAKQKVIEKFDISMQRLQLEYVDILYLHSADNKAYTQFKPFLEALQQIKKEGRTRFIGVSTHSNEPEVIRAAIETGVYDVVLTAYNFQQQHLDDMNAALEEANKAGMGIVAMKTLAGGFMDKERKKPVNASAALKWALQNEHVHTSIPGMTSFDQMEEDWAIAGDIKMTEEEKKHVQMSYIQGSTMYCNACKKCLPQCPFNVPIPEMMRAYMYTYGYQNLEKAHTLLKELTIPNDACVLCDTCDVQCTQNFNVKDKVLDIKRLLDVPQDFIA